MLPPSSSAVHPSPTCRCWGEGCSGVSKAELWGKPLREDLHIHPGHSFLGCAAELVVPAAPACPQISALDLIPEPHKWLSPGNVDSIDSCCTHRMSFINSSVWGQAFDFSFYCQTEKCFDVPVSVCLCVSVLNYCG